MSSLSGSERWNRYAQRSWSTHPFYVGKLLLDSMEAPRRADLAAHLDPMEEIQASNQTVSRMPNLFSASLPARNGYCTYSDQGGKILGLHPHFLSEKSNFRPDQGGWFFKEAVGDRRMKALYVWDFGHDLPTVPAHTRRHSNDYVLQAAFTIPIGLFFSALHGHVTFWTTHNSPLSEGRNQYNERRAFYRNPHRQRLPLLIRATDIIIPSGCTLIPYRPRGNCTPLEGSQGILHRKIPFFSPLSKMRRIRDPARRPQSLLNSLCHLGWGKRRRFCPGLSPPAFGHCLSLSL